jgi:hypothetical protein
MGGFSFMQNILKVTDSTMHLDIGESSHIKEDMFDKMWIQLVVLNEGPKGSDLSINDKLIRPLATTMMLMNTVNLDQFKRIFIPGLQRLVNFVYNTFMMKPVVSQEIADACRVELEDALRSYGEIENLEVFKKNWDLSKSENQICVEGLFARVFTCSFMIAVKRSITDNKISTNKKSLMVIIKNTLDGVLKTILPWFILFKILQRNKAKEGRVTYKSLRKRFKEFFKMLDILHCILTFSKEGFTRKTTWTNFHSK